MDRIKTDVWEREDHDVGIEMHVEIERTDVDEVALFTFEDGEGSIISLYWSRERAIEVARQILNAASLYTPPS